MSESMKTQNTILGEISRANAGMIIAMKELDFDREKRRFHLKHFEQAKTIEELTAGLKGYHDYGSNLASRAAGRLSHSLTVQLLTICLISCYDSGKHRAFFEMQILGRIGPKTPLLHTQALQAMVDQVAAQTPPTLSDAMCEPRLVLLLSKENRFRRHKSERRQNQELDQDGDMVPMEELWFDAPGNA